MKSIFLFLALSIICPSVIWAKPATTSSTEHVGNFVPFSGKIIGDKVRLRLSPNLEGHIVKELTRGQVYAVVDEKDGYYALVPSKDSKAYVYRTFVLDGVIEADNVNIRLSPDLNSPIVAQCKSGEKVNIHQSDKASKWLEMEMPKNVHFWVAKEYIEQIGSIEYVDKIQSRLSEAHQLLATADLLSETEFRKSFEEIDIARILHNYQRVVKEFSDLDTIKEEAKVTIQSIQKQYCDKKIAFLENKAGQAAIEVKNLTAKLSSLDQYDDILDPQVYQISDESIKELASPKLQTDKMKVWQPLEYSIFQAWAVENPGGNLQDFYTDEFLNSKQITGIIEPFNSLIKNKPGDFILTQKDQTVAYLYSTHVNLQDMLGKQVTIKIIERDSHNFAFPAYYVLDAHE